MGEWLEKRGVYTEQNSSQPLKRAESCYSWQHGHYQLAKKHNSATEGQVPRGLNS